MKTFKIPGVTPAQLEVLKGKLIADKSVIVTNTDGTFTVTGHGVEAIIAYNVATKDLTVNVVHKPFFITMNHIENGIKGEM